jgi:nucleoside-diphosphate-sugar epimerase
MSNAFVASPSDSILVTGAAGFIGVKVVETLLRYGYRNVRCFARPSSSLDRLHQVIRAYSAESSVKLISGDVLSQVDCLRATEGVSVVCHLAAGFDKSFAAAFMSSVVGTRNLIEAFLERGRPVRFVNVSSFAVYSNRSLARGSLLDESAPLEDDYQERYDAYGYGKLKQEELVQSYRRSHNLPCVILRPGTVFGPGKRDLTGRIGVNTFGFFVHIGGGNQLPLTYVDNCAEAVVLAGLVPGIEGEIMNVVDDAPLTSRQFLKAYKTVRPVFSVRLPYAMAYGFCWMWETYSRRSKGQLPPAFNRRRCAAEWKGNRFSNRRLRERLGWVPRVSMDEGMRQFLAQFSTQVG